MDDFEKEMKAGFLEEATQLIADAEQCFLTLESSPNDSSILEKIFRLAHNLKGSANAVGFAGLGEFTHEFESYLLKLKKGELPVSSQAVSLLLRCNDHVSTMVAGLRDNFDAQFDSQELMAELKAQVPGAAPATPAAAPAPAPAEEPAPAAEAAPASGFEGEAAPTMEEVSALLAAETAQKLQPYAEPPQAAAPPAPAPKAEPPKPKAASPAAPGGKGAAAQDESIRVSVARVEKLLNFVGELVILQTVLREQAMSANPTLRKTVHQLGKVTKEVQDISMSLRMVPLKQTFQKMQRIVRDTSAALKKKVDLHLHGEETELDKTVLENLSDPLVHLIRNAVDHGIESNEKRVANGKVEAGQVHLSAYHQGGSLVIDIQDDGGGMDPAKLTSKAIEKGILKPGTVLADKDAYNLIFAPGFSTKTEVTDVSGRGVGMDVVKTNIERLQGEILIETQLGKGTLFRIKLPLTLAITDGMVIKSSEERFVIPLSHVHESVQPSKNDVHQVTGLGEVFALRGETLPLYRLSALLGRKSAIKHAHEGTAIVVRTQAQPFSVLVDDIIGQYQVVIKQLGDEHKALRGFSGSAILGDGRPALILELGDLVERSKPMQRATA